MTDIAFEPPHTGDVVAAMRELRSAGRGWINLVPVHAGSEALGSRRSVPAMIFGRLSGRGSEVVRITWTAPSAGRRSRLPAELGIEHPAGPKAVQRLRDAGHQPPVRWAVVADHPLRGLVLRLPPDADDQEILAWALRAAELLGGSVPASGWSARVFTGA